jgi:hypothetical protein
MDRQSTKTREELEQEEAARLVRPAPKYKPPRRDRRRERDDSDKEVDPDEVADRKDRSDNYKDVGGSTGPKGRISPLVGSVVARYAISSYSTPSLMTSVSEKAAVYHGVAPYKETPGYVPWTQPHQRDIGEGDLEVLLKSAKDWLKTPVLSVPLVDANRDIQLRAALDLAIYDSLFNGQIQPTVYNQLLAKLAGVDADETLLTQRKATEVATMKASTEIRKLAAKYAAQDAPLAYDLMDLASKVAQDEGQDDQGQQQKQAQDDQQGQQDQGQKQAADKYAGLRSAVIQAASKNPEARAAFIPVLQAIKSLDV